MMVFFQEVIRCLITIWQSIVVLIVKERVVTIAPWVWLQKTKEFQKHLPQHKIHPVFYLYPASHIFEWSELNSLWVMINKHDNVGLHERNCGQRTEQERVHPHSGGLEMLGVRNLWRRA